MACPRTYVCGNPLGRGRNNLFFGSMPFIINVPMLAVIMRSWTYHVSAVLLSERTASKKKEVLLEYIPDCCFRQQKKEHRLVLFFCLFFPFVKIPSQIGMQLHIVFNQLLI